MWRESHHKGRSTVTHHLQCGGGRGCLTLVFLGGGTVWGGGGSSNYNGKTANQAGRTIRKRYDGLRQAEEGHASLTVRAAFFYADYVLVDSTYPGWIQSVFDTLIGIFNQVGLHTNVCNTMGVV